MSCPTLRSTQSRKRLRKRITEDGAIFFAEAEDRGKEGAVV